MNDVNARSVFRRNLNAQIKRADIKRTTLSKLTGASAGQVNRWTEGSLMPTWREFCRIMDIFGISDKQMLGTPISENSYNIRFKS